MEELILKRECPSCKKDIIYKNIKTYSRAEHEKSKCHACVWTGRVHSEESKKKISTTNKGRVQIIKRRPISDYEKEMTSKRMVGNRHGANNVHTEAHKKKMSDLYKGKVFSEITLKRMSDAKKGRKISEEHQAKINKNLPRGDNHPNKKEENKEKIRKKAIERLANRKAKGFIPAYNPTACLIFDKINLILGWNGVHAENNGEYYINRFFLDFYEPKFNVAIEYDEIGHYTTKNKEKDRIRQDNIIQNLRCHFFRIKYNENWEETILPQLQNIKNAHISLL